MGLPLLKTQKTIRRFFNFISPVYDAINPRIYGKEMLRLMHREIRGGKILDVGVGTGYTTLNYRGAVGVDLSEKMIARAKAKGYKGRLILGDVLEQDFKPESFDTIVCAGSLYYMDYDAALTRFRSWLKKDGVILCIVPSRKLLSFLLRVVDDKCLAEIFRRNKFEVSELRKMGRPFTYAYYIKAVKQKRSASNAVC